MFPFPAIAWIHPWAPTFLQKEGGGWPKKIVIPPKMALNTPCPLREGVEGGEGEDETKKFREKVYIQGRKEIGNFVLVRK